MANVITGDETNEFIIGTPQDDAISALGGNDTILGLGGNDTLAGGDGDDFLQTDGGSNVVYGNEGDDDLSSFNANDSLYGGDGDDLLTVLGLNSDDLIDGGDGYDSLGFLISVPGAVGQNVSIGVNPDATLQLTINGVQMNLSSIEAITHITTGPGNDTITGSDNDEVIYSGTGNDEVHGLGGDDTLLGSTGDDSVYGGYGDDDITLEEVSSADIVDGGAGTDTLSLFFGPFTVNDEDLSIAISADSQNGVSVSSNGELLNISSIETLAILATGTGDDTVIGSTADDVISSSGGADSIEGGKGKDFLEAGWGDDTVLGGDGNDTISIFDASLSDAVDGGAGRDTLYMSFSPSLDAIDIQLEDQADGTIDVILDGQNMQIDNVEEFYVYGSYGDDTITGSGHSDLLVGENGNDMIFGGKGSDTLAGEQGDDLIEGGRGKDLLFGGEGSDDFGFHKGDGRDTVMDFEIGADQIVVGADLNASEFDDLTITQKGNDAVINMHGAVAVLLDVDSLELTASDFLFA